MQINFIGSFFTDSWINIKSLGDICTCSNIEKEVANPN